MTARSSSAAIAALIAATPGTALAQPASPRELAELLDPTVTAPTKRAQSPRSVPGSVAVVTEADILARGYVDLVDAIRDLPGVVLIDNLVAEQGGSQLVFRGLRGSDKVVFLLNGRRIFIADRPQSDASTFMRNFPLAWVKRLEVVYGAGSALYGADAMSGVINIVTKDGGEMPGVSAGASYGLRGTTSDHLSVGVPLDEDSSVIAGGRFFRTDGEDFDRRPRFAGSAADRAFWPGSPTRDASFSSDFELLGYRNKGFSMDFIRRAWNAPTVGAGLDRTVASNALSRWIAATDTLTLGYESTLGDTHMDTSLVYDVFSLNPNTSYVLNQRALDPRTEDPAARGAFRQAYLAGSGRAARLEHTVARSFSDDLGVVVGATVEDHAGVPEVSELPRPYDPAEAIDDAGFDTHDLRPIGYQNLGVYAQAQLGFVPGLQTTLGTRVDYNTRYAPSLTPRLGAVYALSPATTLKASYARSYLAPSMGQVYQRFTVPGGPVWLPNTALAPETGGAFEVGVVQDVGRDGTLTVSAFQNRFAGLIEAVTETDAMPQRIQYRNVQDATMTGGELRLDGRLAAGLRGFASVSLVDALLYDFDDDAYAQAPGAVGALARAGVVWRPWPALSLTPRLAWQGAQATDDDNPLTGGAPLPGAWLLDLSARLALTDTLAITLLGTNLLDAGYDGDTNPSFFQQGGAVPQNGRRLQLGLSWSY